MHLQCITRPFKSSLKLRRVSLELNNHVWLPRGEHERLLHTGAVVDIIIHSKAAPAMFRLVGMEPGKKEVDVDLLTCAAVACVASNAVITLGRAAVQDLHHFKPPNPSASSPLLASRKCQVWFSCAGAPSNLCTTLWCLGDTLLPTAGCTCTLTVM